MEENNTNNHSNTDKPKRKYLIPIIGTIGGLAILSAAYFGSRAITKNHYNSKPATEQTTPGYIGTTPGSDNNNSGANNSNSGRTGNGNNNSKPGNNQSRTDDSKSGSSSQKGLDDIVGKSDRSDDRKITQDFSEYTNNTNTRVNNKPCKVELEYRVVTGKEKPIENHLYKINGQMLLADGVAHPKKLGYAFLKVNRDGNIDLAEPLSQDGWKYFVKNQKVLDYGRKSSSKFKEMYGKK